MIAEVSGEFVKIAFEDQVDVLLTRGEPDRPAARFNRTGEDALYLSVDEAGARVAMKKYARSSDPPRVLIRYELELCSLVDLRHPDADELRSFASQSWQDALMNGLEPSSWKVADKLRQTNQVGLLDPSRSNPAMWHVTLLRWNEPGAPTVRMTEDPVFIKL